MKKVFIFSTLCLSLNLYSSEYFYQIEQNDQLGIILFSLGHRHLWPKDGKVNLFKKSFNSKDQNLFYEGSIIKFKEDDILFKKNVTLAGNSLKILKKIKRQSEYDELLKNENLTEEIVENTITPEIEIIASGKTPLLPASKPEIIHSFNLYPGLGGFTARDTEKDKNTSTSTSTGLQPLIQFKGIYSSSLFGSVCVDVLVKKIITDKFSFPLNTDYRIQLVPKWNFTDYFRLAISHSIIAHSYVGKSSDTELPYKLKSKFFGIGLVVPHDPFWFEIFIEKAYSGETQSKEADQSASNGFRIDSELVYPISKNWSILPGVNYYHLKQDSTEYSLSVLELRAVFARDLEF